MTYLWGVEIKDKSQVIKRPAYGSMSVAAALDHDWSGYHVSEKMDGVWHELAIGNSVVVGELMRDDSFYAFDLPFFAGHDIRRQPKSERMAILDTFKLRRPSIPATGESPAAFLQRVLARGGEGIVAAVLDGPFGYDMCKIKRQATFDCMVAAKGRGNMILTMNGEAAGCCALLGASYDAVRVGDVVEIAAFARLASGKFREPRFLRSRPDKSFA